MPETIYEVQNICHRESVERHISMQTRIIQFMLYFAVIIFTFLGTMWGTLMLVPALGTLFFAWYFMGVARMSYEYQLDGYTFHVIRHSGMRSRPKQEDFLTVDLHELIALGEEGDPRLEDAERESAAARPKRITYNVSAHDPSRTSFIAYARGTGEEQGRMLKIYMQPSSQMRLYLKMLCPGKVIDDAW